MKTVKQLLRQPLKTIVGITLMTLAAAILCLCIGQALAAQTTKAALDQRFSTVGIPVVQEDLEGNVKQSSFLLEDELITWLEKISQEHPETVKLLARHGILSAYIPELTPLNMTQEKYFYYKDSSWYSYQSSPQTMPYSCAMLVITLDEVSEPTPVTTTYTVENLTLSDFDTWGDYYAWKTDPETETVTVISGYTVNLTGTVTNAVSIADGYRDPVGRFARLTYTAPTLEELESLNLVPGQQYIVYGMNYSDEHWKLISEWNPDGWKDYLDLENYDPAKFRFLTEDEIRVNLAWAEAFPDAMEFKRDLIAIYNNQQITKREYLQLNSIWMTLDSPVPLLQYEAIRDEQTGELLEVRPSKLITCTDENGDTVTYTLEEYTARYQIPTIARLDGTAEDFLNSDAGASWKAALARDAINNHAFTVIGVDRMDYLADFSLERSQIVEGRDFTAGEQAGSSRVCIIHESLALTNGLSVGDTITLNLYAEDASLPYYYTGALNPAAAFYFDTTPIAEMAEYTIIGLWRGEELWPDVAEVSEYAFSPNTVFVPKASVQTPMQTGNSIVLNTIVPQNGMIEQFHQLTMQAGYAGRFNYNDQGYSTIAANFHNYASLAQQMLTIGVVLYAVLLLLFLLLYPGSQKNNVRTMQSFGAGFFRRFGHVMASSLGIVLPASVLGGWLGMQLWDRMVVALQTTAESAVALQIEPGTLTAISGAQLLFALVLNICVAVFIAAPRGMSARR